MFFFLFFFNVNFLVMGGFSGGRTGIGSPSESVIPPREDLGCGSQTEPHITVTWGAC